MKDRPRRHRPARPARRLGPTAPARPRADVDSAELRRDFESMVSELATQGVTLPGDAGDRLLRYGELVVERSRLLNLIGPADRPRIFTRHVGECLARPLVDRASEVATLVDIGSGAGLPGIPLALACPRLRVVLVEPRLRKAQFLDAAVASLGLGERVGVFQGTAESLGGDGGMRFDLATARAVGRIPSVWSWSRILLAPGGWLVAFKGPNEIEAELEGLVGQGPAGVEVVSLPGKPRVLVFLQAP